MRLAANILKLINSILRLIIPNINNNKNNKFDVIMTSCGIEKIKVIYEVRKITGFGLAEAKHAVENCPFRIKSGVSKKEAEAIKNALTAVGATVVIK